MRKYHKKILLEMIESLEDVNKLVRVAVDKNAVDTLHQALTEQQSVIAQVRGFFQGYSHIPSTVFEALEEYHQLLLSAREKSDFASIKPLPKALTHLTDTIAKDVVAERLEMVFLPYNASMSDSLESIWLAAHADPLTDAYVMPIPFYEKDSEGNFTNEYFHGEFYQGDVTVVDWQKFDLEARHPDVIFIHNPYDHINIVSSVHPKFYSDKLKQYTEKLVYVPYFASGKKANEHFGLVPGIVHADYVFLESEQSRQHYMEICQPLLRISRKKMCEKFLAFGSPKIDKAVNSKPEDFSLPPQWVSLLSSGKKVVMYNTSLSAILSNDHYLVKLKEVLRYFKERDDVVLWWRPHPLTEGTFRSMRPALLAEYQAILQQYKEDGFGIFDESSDLHRAVSHSHMYYGDPSSVFLFFILTDKMVLLQSADIVNMSLEMEDDYLFSDQWYKGMEVLSKNQNKLRVFFTEAFRKWDGENFGDVVYPSGTLSLCIDVLQGVAPAPIMKNVEQFATVAEKRIEEMNIFRKGTNGRNIYQHVKAEVNR